MTVYGYARVSTADQNLEAQLEELRAAGSAKVFREKVSGMRSDRPELAKALKALGRGDMLIVSRLDRLARSPRDLLNILAAIGERGATFKSLGDTWADGSWSPDAYGSRRACRVRARANLQENRRGADARDGKWSALRAKTEAHPASAGGSACAPRGRRESDGNRAELQRQPFYDFAALIFGGAPRSALA
jgi:hypothetical protein